MRLGDRLGGHLVSGHVDALALVTSLDKDLKVGSCGWKLKNPLRIT